MFDMIDDFKKVSPKFTVPQMSMVQERSQALIKRLRRYWLGSASVCQADHPLVKALYSIDAISNDYLDIYYIAREQAPGVSRAYGWVSDTGFGKIRSYGYMYSLKQEIYTYVDFPDSLRLVTDYTLEQDTDGRSYLDWKPVRVKKHPFTDLSYEIPSSTRYRKEFFNNEEQDGICIFEVDLPLLYTMFRIWRNRPESKFETGEEMTYNTFIKTVVLANMIEDHVDLCFINRFVKTLNYLDVDNWKLHERMSAGNTYQYVDDVIAWYIKKFHTSVLQPDLVGSTIQLPSGRCVGEFYQVADVPRVHQNKLCLTLPILDYQYLIFGVLDFSDNLGRAKHYITEFKYNDKAYRGAGIMKTIGNLKPRLILPEFDRISQLIS